MGKLRDAKIFGGIGAILLLFPVVSIVGIVLLFVAVKYIADETKDHDIFKNYLYSFILNIIAIIAFISVLVLSFITLGFSFTNFNPTSTLHLISLVVFSLAKFAVSST